MTRKQHSRFLIGLLVLTSVPFSKVAEAIDSVRPSDVVPYLSVHHGVKKNRFLFGMEVSNVGFPTVALNGIGARLGYEYAVSDKLALIPSLGMAMGAITSSGYLYTGIGAMARYYLIGSARLYQSSIVRFGTSVVSQRSVRKPSVSLVGGLEQLIFSGTQAAYIAVGPSLGATFETQIFNEWIEFSARYTPLSGNNQSITGIFGTISIGFQ